MDWNLPRCRTVTVLSPGSCWRCAGDCAGGYRYVAMCWSRCAVAAGLADAAEMFVESYGELVKPKHEHVHDRKSSKILIRAMCTIDDEMLPNRCHDNVD